MTDYHSLNKVAFKKMLLNCRIQINTLHKIDMIACFSLFKFNLIKPDNTIDDSVIDKVKK